MNRSVIIVCTACVLLALLVLRSCEKTNSRYSTYQDALRAQAIGNWLPSFVPDTATEIQESHVIDTNEVWFQFRSNIWRPEDSGCTSNPVAFKVSFEERRWPRFTRGWADLMRLNHDFRFVKCLDREIDYIIGVSDTQKLTIGWSLGDRNLPLANWDRELKDKRAYSTLQAAEIENRNNRDKILYQEKNGYEIAGIINDDRKRIWIVLNIGKDNAEIYSIPNLEDMPIKCDAIGLLISTHKTNAAVAEVLRNSCIQ
jgi:hypothetical protein